MDIKYKFSDLISLKKLQSIIESFSNIAQVPIAIYDINEEIVVFAKKRDLCVKSLKLNCDYSIQKVIQRIKKGEKHLIEICQDGGINIVGTIVIGNETIAVIITGKFYFLEFDKEQLTKNIGIYNFSEYEGLKGIEQFKTLISEKTNTLLKFVEEFTQMIIDMGYDSMQHFQNEKKIKKAHDKLYNLNKRLESEREEIRSLAYNDAVTGLPNKRIFYKIFNAKILENSLRENDSKGSLLILGLNNFKNVNDTLGYDFGDKILKICGDKLKKILLNDEAYIFKFESDKFLVFIPSVNEETFLINIVERILQIFKEQWSIQRYKILITVSIGVHIFSYTDINNETIIKNADSAMYKAKEAGLNKYVFYDKAISEALERKVKIENCLNKALENEEFFLCYQPQVNVFNNQIEGFEALLRWNSKELGFVSPAEFIPIAEETGLIIPIGRWVIKTACIQNKKWSEKNYKFDHIAVNISAVQLQQLDFVNTVKSILKETGIRAESFEIEITESTLIKSLNLNIKKLEELKSIGVKIALDDFGTGYSSLNYLKMLPVNRIKIDKSFIDDICRGANEEIIIEALVFLGHKMNLDIVAEGVELEEQVEILKNKKCDKIQGYYFSKPLKKLDAENILKTGLKFNRESS